MAGGRRGSVHARPPHQRRPRRAPTPKAGGGMTTELLWTRAETCRRLKIGSTTLWRLQVSGELPSVRIGARVLFRETDLQAFVAHRDSALTPAAPLPRAGSPSG